MSRGVGPASAGGVDPAVSLWAAAVVANGGTVTSPRVALVSKMVACLKAAGTWQLADDYWLLVAENATQALTSLKQRRLATATAAPTFTTDRGYAFNGTTQFIDTGFVQSSMATASSLGNVRAAAYERTNVLSNGTTFGASDTPAGAFLIFVRPRSAASFAVAGTATSTVTGTDSITDSRGLTVASRAGNTLTSLFYKNGVALTPVAATSTATVLMPRSLFIGANDNVGSAATFRAATVGLTSFGAPLTAAQELAEYNAIQAFMTAVGANV